MLKERARTIATGLFAIELLLVAGAFLLAHYLRGQLLPSLGLVPGPFYPLETYLPLLPVCLLVWAALLVRSRLYRSHRTIPFQRELWSLAKVCFGGALLFTLAVFFFRIDERLLASDRVSRLWILLLALLSFAALAAARFAVRFAAHVVRQRGYNYRTVLIVGTSDTARAMAEAIDRHRYWGFQILGFLSRGDGDKGAVYGRYPVLGRAGDLLDIVQQHPVDEVILAVSRQDLAESEEILLALEELGICVRFALDPFPHARGRLEVGDLDGVPLLSFSSTPTGYLRLFLKRLVDVAVAAVLLVLVSPLLLVVSLLLKATSPGPVLFRQTRLGLYGRSFTMLKFRTMVEGAEEELAALTHLNEMSGPVFKMRRDPRVTPVGRLLRRFSLDELPQLWNVLRGDMSLVGPRPPRPEEADRYQRWQRRRLSMRPGLTCLWQISGRNEIDFDRWMELDLQYIDSWSPLLDLKILVKTIPVVLSGRGAS